MEKKNPARGRYRSLNDDAVSQLRQADTECYEQELCTQRIPDTDVLAGWQTPITQPKLAATKKKKNKRHDNNTSNDKRRTPLYSDGIWDDSTEKYSYRYVANNGCYAALKAQLSLPKSLFNQRKHSPSVGVVLSSEHKLLQREITRDLRKEFQSLLEANRAYFHLCESGEDVSDCLEDEQEYRERYPAARPAHSAAPVNSPVNVPPPQPITTSLPDKDRSLETQSAQPAAATRLEDLLINKRCSTNLEKLKQETQLPPPERGWVKSEVVPTYQRTQHASNDEVDALAKKTFNGRKEAETRTKRVRSLGPIEKITPSLREMYDNSKAIREMIKLGCPIQPHSTEITIGSVMSIKRRFDGNRLDGTSKHKNVGATKSVAATAQGVTSNHRVAKPGEMQQRASRLKDDLEVDQTNTNFQTFLPSISGKRITTKLGSLR